MPKYDSRKGFSCQKSLLIFQAKAKNRPVYLFTLDQALKILARANKIKHTGKHAGPKK
jgi:hypothetical protein